MFNIHIFLYFIIIANVTPVPGKVTAQSPKYYYQPQSTPSWGLPHFETPAWSPDGSKIAFQMINREGMAQVCIMNTDGTNQHCITEASSNNAQPCWSPAEDKIAFISDRSGHREIYIMNSDGTEQTQLTNGGKAKGWPAFSPDGRMLSFSQNEEELPNGWWIRSLNTLNLKTGKIRKLHTSQQGGGFSSWSRNGKLIYFYEISPNGLNDIYSIKVDGTGLTNMTNNTEADSYSLDMSPDGSQLSFVHDVDGIPGQSYNWEIFTMKVDGSLRKRITNSPLLDSGQKYSPDGEKFAFISRRSGYYEVYTMNVDGSDVRQLTRQPETEFSGMVKKNGLTHAIKTYHEIRRKEPTGLLFSDYAINIFVEELIDGGKFEEAVDVTKIFADSYPQSSEAYNHLAKAYDRTGKKALAKNGYRESLQLDHNNISAVDYLGFEQALSFFKELASKRQLSEQQINALGYGLMGSGRLDEATEVFELNVEAFPESFNVYDSLGEAYMKAGEKELAIKNYEKSLELNERNTNAVNMLKKLNE